jgi:hypothetical protein
MEKKPVFVLGRMVSIKIICITVLNISTRSTLALKKTNFLFMAFYTGLLLDNIGNIV